MVRYRLNPLLLGHGDMYGNFYFLIQNAWETVILTQQIFIENPLSTSHTLDIMSHVLDNPYSPYFYINTLDKTLYIESL